MPEQAQASPIRDEMRELMAEMVRLALDKEFMKFLTNLSRFKKMRTPEDALEELECCTPRNYAFILAQKNIETIVEAIGKGSHAIIQTAALSVLHFLAWPDIYSGVPVQEED